MRKTVAKKIRQYIFEKYKNMNKENFKGSPARTEYRRMKKWYTRGYISEKKD